MPARPHATHELEFRARLADAGQRVTRVRLAVMEVLAHAGARKTLDAQRILERVTTLDGACVKGTPDADRVTIYRTLNTLVHAGIAHRVRGNDRAWRYGLTDHHRCNDTAHDHEHPHIICDDCGSVECLTDALVTISARRKRDTPIPTTYRIRPQRVTLHGLCAACANTRR